MAYFTRQVLGVEEGIDIRITDKDGNLPIDCLFCGGIAKFQVTDAKHRSPIIQIRVCASPACCAQAFSYILQAGYGLSPEGSQVPEFSHA